MCNSVYNLHIQCVINNDDAYIAYVLPETDKEQIQKQTSSQTLIVCEEYQLITFQFEEMHGGLDDPEVLISAALLSVVFIITFLLFQIISFVLP